MLLRNSLNYRKTCFESFMPEKPCSPLKVLQHARFSAVTLLGKVCTALPPKFCMKKRSEELLRDCRLWSGSVLDENRKPLPRSTKCRSNCLSKGMVWKGTCVVLPTSSSGLFQPSLPCCCHSHLLRFHVAAIWLSGHLITVLCGSPS